MIWWVYDLRIRRSVFKGKNPQGREDALRSMIIKTNLGLFDQMRLFKIVSLNWLVGENDGGHVPGTTSSEDELELGVVKDILLNSGFAAFSDDLMEMEF